MREYGEAIEADLAFRGVDLLDFYRGAMSARRLWVLVQGLPPDSQTATVAHAQPQEAPPDTDRKLAPVRCLADIPVAASMADVGKFVNANGDEFTQMASSQAG